eukprot:jgi/Hompol1/4350/HPOL_003591-RA
MTSLQLVGNDLTQAHSGIIAGICRESVKLKALVLDYNHFGQGSNQIIQALCDNQGCIISKLSMRYCGLDTETSTLLGTLISTLPTLRMLDIGGNTIGDEGLPPISRALAKTRSLTTLGLAFNEISDIVIAGTLPFAELCRSLPTSTISMLDLSGNFFGDHGMDKLADAQQTRKNMWSSGKAPPLKILVPERAKNDIFDAIWTQNASMAVVSKKKK